MKHTRKTWTAAVGATLTAATTANAAVQLVVADGHVGLDEYGSLALAALSFGLTVWGVWRIPNDDTDTT